MTKDRHEMISLAFMERFYTEHDKERERKKERERRAKMIHIFSPPDQCWVDVTVGNLTKRLRFSRDVYLLFPDFADLQIKKAEDELAAMANLSS